jgi:hypothetical protein
MQQLKKLVPGTTFLLGILLGSGSVWQWEKHKLDVVSETAALRQQEIEQYTKLVDLNNEYTRAQVENAQRPGSYNPALKNRIAGLAMQIAFVAENLAALESQLAQLEGREPRKLKLQLVPPNPPINMKVEPQ